MLRSVVVAADTLMPRRVPFDAETLMERLRAALPAIPITGATQLEESLSLEESTSPPSPGTCRT